MTTNHWSEYNPFNMVEGTPNFSAMFPEGLHISREALGQVVSWDRRRDLPLTLEDYMRYHSPSHTLKEFGLTRSRRIVRGINELTEKEVGKVVIARLEQLPEDLSLAFL